MLTPGKQKRKRQQYMAVIETLSSVCQTLMSGDADQLSRANVMAVFSGAETTHVHSIR
jgi:hypothetical protein